MYSTQRPCAGAVHSQGKVAACRYRTHWSAAESRIDALWIKHETHLLLAPPRAITIHHIKVLQHPPDKIPQMIDGSLVRSGRHKRLLAVASHGFMVEENAVKSLLVTDSVGPFLVRGVRDGHGEDIGSEVGAGGGVVIRGCEGDGGHGFVREGIDGCDKMGWDGCL